MFTVAQKDYVIHVTKNYWNPRKSLEKSETVFDWERTTVIEMNIQASLAKCAKLYKLKRIKSTARSRAMAT